MQETPRKGSDTRERVLDVAEAAVLEKGFAATSIEEVIAAVGITKSGFFYHFKDKNELAKALLVRYVEREDALFDQLFARADELNEDPLHGFLVGLKMMSELGYDREHVGKIVEVDLDPRRIARGDSVEAPAEPLAPVEHRRGVELAHVLVEQPVLIAEGGDDAARMPVRQIRHQLRHHLEADEKAMQRILVELVGTGEQLVE